MSRAAPMECWPERAMPRSGGFTLIEMLVALVVLGLVVAGLGQGIRFGLAAWNRAAYMTETWDALDAVDRTLRHLIAQMDPGSESKPTPFSASSGRLAFVSTLPGMPGAPARRVEAVLMVDDRHRLVLRWRPYMHAERLRLPPFTETELLRGVDRLDLAFWQRDSGWSVAWQSADLPALVRIRLAFVQPVQRRWPDIVAAPGLDRP
jgi:general secretion pathway protein J